MAKRIKTVTGGRLSAVVCYTIPTVRDDPEERARRGRMSKEAQELINMRRSWQKLEMMLAANFCARDLHVVLTYGDQHLPPDRDAANKLLRKMLSQLRKYRGLCGQTREKVSTAVGCLHIQSPPLLRSQPSRSAMSQ